MTCENMEWTTEEDEDGDYCTYHQLVNGETVIASIDPVHKKGRMELTTDDGSYSIGKLSQVDTILSEYGLPLMTAEVRKVLAKTMKKVVAEEILKNPGEWPFWDQITQSEGTATSA